MARSATAARSGARKPSGKPAAPPTNKNKAVNTPLEDEDDLEGRTADLSTLARGGMLNLVGAAATGILTFALVTVMTRGLGPASYGGFVSAMGIFTILSNTSELGADTGLVRMISRYRALDRLGDVRKTVVVAMLPVLAVGSMFAVCMYLFANDLADIFGQGKGSEDIADFARAMAPFVPLMALCRVMLSGTRGFGTMFPSVMVDKIGRPAVQLILAVAVLSLWDSHALVALSWALPMGVSGAIALYWFWGLLLRNERRARRSRQLHASRPTKVLADKFWRFTAPRGLAGIFQVVVLWINTLLIGSLDSTKSAGVFSASTRYITAGLMVGVAIQQVAGPKLSELLAQRSMGRAKAVYQTTTGWLMTATWPLYLTFAIFSPTLLRVFGSGFSGGAVALSVLGVCMLMATAVGTVDMVLLMGGKSSYNLYNTVAGLSANVVLNLLLVPSMGVTGAAIAWSSSILITNLAPLYQVYRGMDMHPFGPGFFKAALAAGGVYGGLGLIFRFALGTSLPVFFAYHVVAGLAYLALLWRFRQALQLPVLLQEMRRRRKPKNSQSPVRA